MKFKILFFLIFCSYTLANVAGATGIDDEELNFDSVERNTLFTSESDVLVEGLINIVGLTGRERNDQQGDEGCLELKLLLEHFKNNYSLWIDEFEFPLNTSFQFTLVKIASRDEYDNPDEMEKLGTIDIESEDGVTITGEQHSESAHCPG